MTMEPRISLITLGVEDVARATAFYEQIGLKRSGKVGDKTVSFFQLGGLVLALFLREELAKDAGLPVPVPQDGAALSLAYNTRSDLEVDKLVAAFVAAGARLVKAPEKTFWGGYSGYVADPDGHLWEIAHNPFWEITEEGDLKLPV